VLEDHGLAENKAAPRFADATALPKGDVGVVVWGFEAGFETPDLAVIGEQDILGDRLVRPKRASKRPQDFLAEVTALTPGDLVVHVDHGIGRFEGLKTITAAGAPHDCLDLQYAGDARLYLPVENIELLSRYGSEETEVQLERLGGSAWQARQGQDESASAKWRGALMKSRPRAS
jgi:transcription-repair coupling factor (superfamily II helicase)